MPSVSCRACGAPTDEELDALDGTRTPCPQCGSTVRTLPVHFEDAVTAADHWKGREALTLLLDRLGAARALGAMRQLGGRVRLGRQLARSLVALCSVPVLCSASPSDEADKLVSESYSPREAGVAVAVVREGRVVFERTIGLANLDSGEPIRHDTRFQVASMSKQFTSYAVLALAIEGKLDVNRPVADRDSGPSYLANPPPVIAGSGITVRHLASHTSGLRDFVWAVLTAGRRWDDVLLDEHVSRFLERQEALNAPPGTEWMYNNTGYVVLSWIAGNVSGRGFETYMREAVFEPLGMRDTGFLPSQAIRVPRRAVAYGVKSEGCWFGYPRDPFKCLNGTGITGPMGLETSLRDMIKWLAFLQSKLEENAGPGARMLRSSTQGYGVRVTRSDCGGQDPAKWSYGYGLFLDELGGHKVACHAGIWNGFRGYMAMFPDAKVSVVVLSNRGSDPREVQTLGNRLASLFIPGIFVPGRVASPAATTSIEPAADCPSLNPGQASVYAGRYASRELDTVYTVHANLDGRLVASQFARGDAHLCHREGDRFDVRTIWLSGIRFTRRDGCVDGFLADASPAARNMRFVRIEDDGARACR